MTSYIIFNEKRKEKYWREKTPLMVKFFAPNFPKCYSANSARSEGWIRFICHYFGIIFKKKSQCSLLSFWKNPAMLAFKKKCLFFKVYRSVQKQFRPPWPNFATFIVPNIQLSRKKIEEGCKMSLVQLFYLPTNICMVLSSMGIQTLILIFLLNVNEKI